MCNSFGPTKFDPTKFDASATMRLKTCLDVYYFKTAKIFITKATEIENKTEPSLEQKYEYFGYCIHSLISSVMGLEACINRNLSDIGDSTTLLPYCNNTSHGHRILLEKAICALFNHHDHPRNFSLDPKIKNIIFLRNQYIHYDFEAIPGDIFPTPLESERKLNEVLCFFSTQIDDDKFVRGPVYSNCDLFPFGLLSSSFLNWVFNNIMEYLEKLKRDIPNMKLPDL